MTDKLSLDELLKLGKKVKEWENQSEFLSRETVYTGTYQNISVEVSKNDRLVHDPVFSIFAYCAKVVLGESEYVKGDREPSVGDPRVEKFYLHIDKTLYQQAGARISELQKKQKKMLEQGPQKLLEHVRSMLK